MQTQLPAESQLGTPPSSASHSQYKTSLCKKYCRTGSIAIIHNMVFTGEFVPTCETHTGAVQWLQCDPRISGVGSEEKGSLVM